MSNHSALVARSSQKTREALVNVSAAEWDAMAGLFACNERDAIANERDAYKQHLAKAQDVCVKLRPMLKGYPEAMKLLDEVVPKEPADPRVPELEKQLAEAKAKTGELEKALAEVAGKSSDPTVHEKVALATNGAAKAEAPTPAERIAEKLGKAK